MMRAKTTAAVVLAIIIASSVPRPSAGADRAQCPPPILLWAWERADELDGIDPRLAGVAVLAATFTLDGESVRARPRLQPIRLAPDVYRFPVVRIEVARQRPVALSDPQRERIAAGAAAIGRGERRLQIDFDATTSQRSFYRALLADLRKRLPAETTLGVTALASWALFDPWIADLPIDEATPMLFRMGADSRMVAAHLQSGGDVRVALAGRALGLSTDEPIAGLPPHRRVYLFHPRPWTSIEANAAIVEIRSWQGSVSCSQSF